MGTAQCASAKRSGERVAVAGNLLSGGVPGNFISIYNSSGNWLSNVFTSNVTVSNVSWGALPGKNMTPTATADQRRSARQLLERMEHRIRALHLRRRQRRSAHQLLERTEHRTRALHLRRRQRQSAHQLLERMEHRIRALHLRRRQRRSAHQLLERMECQIRALRLRRRLLLLHTNCWNEWDAGYVHYIYADANATLHPDSGYNGTASICVTNTPGPICRNTPSAPSKTPVKTPSKPTLAPTDCSTQTPTSTKTPGTCRTPKVTVTTNPEAQPTDCYTPTPSNTPSDTAVPPPTRTPLPSNTPKATPTPTFTPTQYLWPTPHGNPPTGGYTEPFKYDNIHPPTGVVFTIEDSADLAYGIPTQTACGEGCVAAEYNVVGNIPQDKRNIPDPGFVRTYSLKDYPLLKSQVVAKWPTIDTTLAVFWYIGKTLNPYLDSYNTCGSVAIDMIINSVPPTPPMPTPTPIPVAKIPVGDVFLTLIQVIQEKKLTETDILLAKSTDTPPIVTNASITTEPLSPGLPQPEESLNGVLIKYGFTPQHIQLDATADVVASLQNGNALIANVPINIKNDRGLISLYSPQVGHYVVIKGVSLNRMVKFQFGWRF